MFRYFGVNWTIVPDQQTIPSNQKHVANDRIAFICKLCCYLLKCLWLTTPCRFTHTDLSNKPWFICIHTNPMCQHWMTTTKIMMTSASANFPRYWPFVGDNLPVNGGSPSVTRSFFLWPAPEQTDMLTIETPVIWNAIAVIMVSP